MQIIYANIKRCSLQDVSVHLSHEWKEFNSNIIMYAMTLIWKKNCTHFIYSPNKVFWVPKASIHLLVYCCPSSVFFFLSWIIINCWNFVVANFPLIFFIRLKCADMVSDWLTKDCVCRRRNKRVFYLIKRF